MKVLLIEDDFWCVDILSIRLRSLGCDVTVAVTASQGLEQAETGGYDLILTDLKLQNSLETGAELLRALRATPATTNAPIYLASAYVYHEGDMPELAGLVDGHLPKPFKFKQLQAIVERHKPAISA